MIVVFIIVFIATSKITLVTAEAPQPIIVDAIETLHKSEYTKEDIINLKDTIKVIREILTINQFINHLSLTTIMLLLLSLIVNQTTTLLLLMTHSSSRLHLFLQLAHHAEFQLILMSQLALVSQI